MKSRPEKGNAPVVGATEASSVKNPVQKGINMPNSTIATASKAITVPFHGAELYVVEHNGQPYTPMKAIVEGMGLDWRSQAAKFRGNKDRWGVVMITTPTKGDEQGSACLPLRKLPGWLMTLHPSRLTPEVRARVIQYQNECDDALWQYWNDGLAVNPRAFSVHSGQTLTAEQADELRYLVEGWAKKLSADTKVQGKFIMQAWSKLKSHFKVGYRQIPQECLHEALSIVGRHAAEWEVVDETEAEAVPTLRGRRWLVSTDHHGNETVRPIGDNQFVWSYREMARGIATGDLMPSVAELVDLAAACHQRLVGRLGNPAVLLAP